MQETREYYTPRAVTQFMVDRIDPKPGESLFDPACGTGGFLTCAMRHMRDHYVKRPEQEAEMQSGLRAVEKNPSPICSAQPTCCCMVLKTPALCAMTTHWQRLHQLGAERPR